MYTENSKCYVMNRTFGKSHLSENNNMKPEKYKKHHTASGAQRLRLDIKTSIPAKARFGRPYCPINLILTLSPSLIDF